MIYIKRSLLATVAITACMMYATPSFSDTVVHETVTETTGQPVTTTTETQTQTDEQLVSGGETHVYHLSDFDINHNGILSTSEVGKILFKVFDADGNGVIDNNEYERRVIISIAPVEKDTVVTYSFNNNGRVEKITRTNESFMEDSRLALFNNKREGLSAHEFTGQDFLAVDVNRDHAIDLKEWQGTYIASIDKKNKESASINK